MIESIRTHVKLSSEISKYTLEIAGEPSQVLYQKLTVPTPPVFDGLCKAALLSSSSLTALPEPKYALDADSANPSIIFQPI